MLAGRRRRLVTSLGLAALVGALVLAPVWRSLERLVQPWVLALASPLYRLTQLGAALGSGPQLARENETLRQTLAAHLSVETELQTVLRENQELKALNLLPLSATYDHLGVAITGRLQDERGTSYLINRGLAEGLTPGLALVAGYGVRNGKTSALLVGVITRVGPSTAQFSLTTSNQSQVVAEVANAARSRGLAVGEYNLGLELRFVPLADDLSAGQSVVTSNLDSLMPPGLLVGTITEVQKQEGDFFQTATLAPPLPLDSFRFLEVLKPH